MSEGDLQKALAEVLETVGDEQTDQPENEVEMAQRAIIW